MSRYQLSHKARSDILTIREFTLQHWGATKSLEYVAWLRDRMRWLAKAPARGKHRDELGPGLFSYPQGSHIIFYRVADNGIEVVRVLHQTMDSVRHLT